MAYVPGYNYDIFISYAHLDNERMFDEGWVETFYKSLGWCLGSRTGRMSDIKIWWDNKKLDGTKLFDNTIGDGVEQSAIMISLVSKFYLESKYCALEMDMFSKKACAEPIGLNLKDRKRMVHVLLQDIHFDEWPAHFSGSTGFSFFTDPEKVKLGKIMKARSPEYIEKMDMLADSILDLLNEFRAEALTKESATPVLKEAAITVNEVTASKSVGTDTGALAAKATPGKKDDDFTIYFAEVTDSLITTRKRTIAELEKKGYTIITLDPANNLQQHSGQVKQVLTGADLSVHLLDLYPGREIEGDTVTWYPKLETELGIQSTASNMIWTPQLELSEVEEEGYRAFLASLDNGIVSAEKTEVIHDHKSMITQHVTDLAEKLRSRKLARQIRAESSAEKTTQVLIDTNIDDQASAWDLGKALIENGFQPVIYPGVKDPTMNIDVLADRISQVQKLIFYYGNADKDWIKQRMSATLHMAMDKDLAMDDFFVYLAPPGKDPQDVMPRQKWVNVRLIDSANTSKETAMSNLVRQLKGQPA